MSQKKKISQRQFLSETAGVAGICTIPLAAICVRKYNSYPTSASGENGINALHHEEKSIFPNPNEAGMYF
jgi:hypothetical protein